MLLKNNIETIVLFDPILEKSQQIVLDLVYSSSIEKLNTKIISTDKYDDITNSDVVIVSSGITKIKGMDFTDLVDINNRIMKLIGLSIKQFCPNAFVICITSPVEIMVNILQNYSNVNANKIVGLSNILDTAVLKIFLSEKLNISTKNINLFTLGGPYHSVLPLIRFSNVAGIILEDLIKVRKITELDIIKTLDKKKISLLENSIPYYTYASEATAICTSYLYNKKKIFTCSTKIHKYAYDDKNIFFFNTPIRIDNNGVKEIKNVILSPSEKEKLDQMITYVIDLNKNIINTYL